MKKVLSIVLTVILVMSLSILIAGCKKEAATETTVAETTVAETTVAETTAVETTAAETTVQLTFGNIQPGPDPWYQYSIDAFKYYAKKEGVTVNYLNSEYNQDKDIANLEDLIAKKVNAISVFPMTADLGQKYAQKANAAKIPIVMEAVTPAEGTGEYVTVVSFSYKMLGEAIAEYVNKKYPEAKLAYITGKPGTGVVEQYVEGLTGKLKELNSKVELVSQQPTDWNRQQAMDITQNLLQSGMKIDVIFANNEDMAGGVIQVLKEQNKLGKIAVVSTGASPEGIKLIQAGELEATAAGSASLEGALCFRASLDAVKGVQVPKLIVPPTMMVTKDNIDSAITWEINDKLIDAAKNFKY